MTILTLRGKVMSKMLEKNEDCLMSITDIWGPILALLMYFFPQSSP